MLADLGKINRNKSMSCVGPAEWENYKKNIRASLDLGGIP